VALMTALPLISARVEKRNYVTNEPKENEITRKNLLCRLQLWPEALASDHSCSLQSKFLRVISFSFGSFVT